MVGDSAEMISMVQFARTGNPNGAGLPEWPQYESERRACLWFDDKPRIVGDHDGEIIRRAYGIM